LGNPAGRMAQGTSRPTTDNGSSSCFGFGLVRLHAASTYQAMCWSNSYSGADWACGSSAPAS